MASTDRSEDDHLEQALKTAIRYRVDYEMQADTLAEERRLSAEKDATIATLRELADHRQDMLARQASALAQMEQERDKWNRAARVLCGAHVGVPQSTCPVCLVAEKDATIADFRAQVSELRDLQDILQRRIEDMARVRAEKDAKLAELERVIEFKNQEIWTTRVSELHRYAYEAEHKTKAVEAQLAEQSATLARLEQERDHLRTMLGRGDTALDSAFSSTVLLDKLK